MPVDGSLSASHRVYRIPAPIPTTVNDKLLPLFVECYLIDALPLEAQNIPLDVDSHSPVLCKVVRSLIYQQITWESASFFTHRTGEEPPSGTSAPERPIMSRVV